MPSSTPKLLVSQRAQLRVHRKMPTGSGITACDSVVARQAHPCQLCLVGRVGGLVPTRLDYSTPATKRVQRIAQVSAVISAPGSSDIKRSRIGFPLFLAWTHLPYRITGHWIRKLSD
jgi:hypothetical protein